MLASSSRTESELRPWNRELCFAQSMVNNTQQSTVSLGDRDRDRQKIVAVCAPTSSKPSALPGPER